MNPDRRKKAIVIGAGPAGLTAAYELLARAGIQPVVLEKSEYMGGISRTVVYKGNRMSYLRGALLPIRKEETLEQFFINRFGRELYRTFFKSYTEKVWGVPCDRISAEWGARRVKGLSILATLMHAVRKPFRRGAADIGQKGTETSLIEQFLYPKFGPGQMWEEAARQIREMGGEIRAGYRVERISTDGWRVTAVEAVNSATGERETFEGDYFFSTAPVREVMRAFDVAPPANVLGGSDGLVYRDFITVGLLLRSLRIHDETPQGRKLVADEGTVWVGLEYFCNESDEIWKLSDERMAALAIEELSRIEIIDAAEVLDSTVLRMEKTYPAYFGTYGRFDEIRRHVDRYANLFLIGRNGMHRYNNQDHSTRKAANPMPAAPPNGCWAPGSASRAASGFRAACCRRAGR